MVELYSPQQLEIPSPATDWRVWGNGLRAIDVFSNEAIPMTDNFQNWFDNGMIMSDNLTPPAIQKPTTSTIQKILTNPKRQL